ncbi:hypothetical protein E5S70_17490 [Ensifer adhaerens]|uniref:hypothetical protein n=1 Tax=Ensifer canadensis TaxID=555315 RepID=UPI00148FF17C|nr:hypothetical protein [Ensifer canadensis]NOV17847.1 hypothetical protein [Ensifer canadensis]
MIDQSALFDAMTAFWVEGENKGNEEGVKAAIAAYLDRMGLTLIHSIAVSNRSDRMRAMAANCAQARREQRFGDRTS